MISDSALTVSQLNMYIKMMFESDIRLQKVLLIGEISNFVNHYKTGHCYFSLKDDSCGIKAVMFAGNARKLKFVPENGMRVYVSGRVSVFERDGVYQIYVDSMEPEGAGALMAAFNQLKDRLEKEGLFSPERKKPLPEFPNKIGVITSASGAAFHDIVTVMSRRYPLGEIIFYPAAVQGPECGRYNVKALREMNKREDIDVIILGRGGGSAEDLWGYNDESLVREIANSKIPVVTGIGHEIDFTLSDFAADVRAATPSAAAEIVTPDITELYQWTDSLIFRLENAASSIIEKLEDTLKNSAERLKYSDPVNKIEKQSKDIELMKSRLETAVSVYLGNAEKQLAVADEKLKMLSPVKMLQKGYAMIFRDDTKIKSAAEISENDLIKVMFSDGTASCRIEEIRKYG